MHHGLSAAVHLYYMLAKAVPRHPCFSHSDSVQSLFKNTLLQFHGQSAGVTIDFAALALMECFDIFLCPKQFRVHSISTLMPFSILAEATALVGAE